MVKGILKRSMVAQIVESNDHMTDYIWLVTEPSLFPASLALAPLALFTLLERLDLSQLCASSLSQLHPLSLPPCDLSREQLPPWRLHRALIPGVATLSRENTTTALPPPHHPSARRPEYRAKSVLSASPTSQRTSIRKSLTLVSSIALTSASNVSTSTSRPRSIVQAPESSAAHSVCRYSQSLRFASWRSTSQLIRSMQRHM
jgi:hypothetical protein